MQIPGNQPGSNGHFQESNRNPNANKRKKVSEYGMQLKEKQKLKFIYGVLEKPFYHYFEIAEKMEGKAGENLITILESRLDNVVFRMGMGSYKKRIKTACFSRSFHGKWSEGRYSFL